MPEPLVSVVIPTYNRVALLREAIDSVRRQTYPHWELIVVDDGSTDDTPALLASLDEPRLRVVRNHHCGHPGPVRNAGIARASGEYLAFLDDDDLWDPTKLAVQIQVVRDRGERWSYTGFVRLNREGQPFWQTTPDRVPSGRIFEPLLELHAAVALPTVLAERSLVQEAGGFNVAMRIHEDYALWLELAFRTGAAATSQQLTVVRDHAGRIRRPEGHRFMVAIYRDWYTRVGDRPLRSICKRRIADTYLAAGRYRLDVRQWSAAVPPTVGAFRWAWWYTLRRLMRSLGRRALRTSRPNA